MLTIAPSGHLMYGFWSGISNSGEKHYGGWIHARSKDYFEEGKQLLAGVTAELIND